LTPGSLPWLFEALRDKIANSLRGRAVPAAEIGGSIPEIGRALNLSAKK
jgi:hypothetical protein